MSAYAEQVARHLRELGISPTYGVDRRLPMCEEPPEVVLIGLDIFGRARHLVAPAAARWRAMRDAASADMVDLLLVSAFRTLDYQRAIIDRKLQQGTPIDEILRATAAPGYSEHHTGRAVDIATRGCPPLTEAFETTAAFAWLSLHASRFGFVLSFPRGNPHGLVYEPWHWVYRGAERAEDAEPPPSPVE